MRTSTTWQKGQGGRPAGTRNKHNLGMEERWAALVTRFPKADEQEFLARTIAGDMDCRTCHGKKRTTYVDKDGKLFTRMCASCDGTGKEKISVADGLRAAQIIASRRWAEKKAIEVTGEDGGPITACIELIVRKAERGDADSTG
jgi:DnaJ-class molecular chaperone